MIRGTVNPGHEAVIPLRVRGPGGLELDFDAIVDTGFTGSLTLPPTIISLLRLALRARVNIQLPDGTLRDFDTYDVEVEWDGTWVSQVVSELDSAPLIGVGLLVGHEVFIEFVLGGVADITAIP